MEASPASSEGSSREVQCIGKLEIVRPKPASGFLCGSIPVPTDKEFHAFYSALVPSRQTVTAPRYRVLPTETDLNLPPLPSNSHEKILPIGALQSKDAGDLPWDGGAVASNLTRKCEALAVSGLVEYGDEIDVIAPADILKQIFKMPYSKARLSIVVYRIGQALVLSTGPDVEEGEKLVRRHKNQSKCAEQSLLLNFAMHSVRMEACDCPPTYHATTEKQSKSSVLPGGSTSQVLEQTDGVSPKDLNSCAQYKEVKQDAFFWGSKKGKRSKKHDPVKKVSEVGGKPRCSNQESEKHRSVGDDEFLRVLFWQFYNFRMLIGSDLLLFSNEKYVAVSLHLWDITRQVTPLTWLEAWLDNVMASVPELAICYHENGVVQGYELLKTDDIFLLKGVSDDGTPAFHPYVVQQNGLSVLRFLQENCKQDPGAYWLYKGAGEDGIQLFDLSLIPKNHSSSDFDDSSNSLPSMLYRGRCDSLFSLGTLLYRIAHRLSLSMNPTNKAKCARFFKKCLDFLDEPDHLVVRAFAHEQFARLILNYDEDLDLTLDSPPLGCEVEVVDAEEEESLNFLSSTSETGKYEGSSSLVEEDKLGEGDSHHQNLLSEVSSSITSEAYVSSPRMISLRDQQGIEPPVAAENSQDEESFAVCKVSPTASHVVQTVADPISSKLAAIHHISQAIKSLRWMRQLQSSEPKMDHIGAVHDSLPSSVNISVCACGDVDCIEVCDLREWLPKSKLDHRLWKLVLLLGESYLALGQAYKEDGQLHQSLKVVELACLVYGSMPQELEETRFISSMVGTPLLQNKLNDKDVKLRSFNQDLKEVDLQCDDLSLDHYSSTYLFWAKTWTLVGDVYVEFHSIYGRETSEKAEKNFSTRELKISSEVVKEVNRLKKKLGQFKNCSACSLVNCSCQSDRANSGSSASSSRGESIVYSRKHNKKTHFKTSTAHSVSGDREHDYNCTKIDDGMGSNRRHIEPKRNARIPVGTCNMVDSGTKLSVGNSEVEDNVETGGHVHSSTSQSHVNSKESQKVKTGGIFKYLGGPVFRGSECNLTAALSCYEEARKALGQLPAGSVELQSVMRKKGWVCNELGRWRLERKELKKAEMAFIGAIDAFRAVSDHTNIILINCNLGHGRRALAEEIVSKIEDLKVHGIVQNAYCQALETAELEYTESLRYYGSAKNELSGVAEDSIDVPSNLRTEVHTQLAHTYLRLGMLLARLDINEVHDIETLEDVGSFHTNSNNRGAKKGLKKKHKISANDAIREALSVYESLGDIRKQEAAYAYFQLACYQKNCSLKYLESDSWKKSLSKDDNAILQRVKQYASLAERNWQRALEFYGPKTHPTMYLTILVERSALSLSLSSSLHSNAMLELAFSRMLEGRHVSDTDADSLKMKYSEIHSKFWNHLQILLKKMVGMTLPTSSGKSSASQPHMTPSRSGEASRLRELYKMSLKSNDLRELQKMHTMWTSKLEC
ncbi:uncharacterized protein LOC111489444 [Cucurbita maxima]|uniref:Uncharacterized protein LOC111489444 n=1 Tax=Cucurbita maxima TaxID=3661 RepID=A0A6J1JYH6_CUCMA|nr:uncharacterized protein LOC111489444 [Cucurbita maxima]XP_022993426.1 uncharacterized protein LOC111489444 [Cucurbita maxima]